MRKFGRTAKMLLLCAAIAPCTACDTSYTAQVKLDDLIKLDSARFGHLNSAFVKTGDIINLNPVTKTATRVGTIPVTAVPTVVLDSLDIAAGNSLNVNFTGNAPVGDLKAVLST